VGPTYKCSLGSNVVSVTVFEIFRLKILTDHLLTLVGLTPEPKVTGRRDDLPSMLIYHQTKFQHDPANGLKDMRYQSFSLFSPRAKVHQKGDNVVDSEVYHPAKFHRSMSTHARDIRYQISCGHTHTHTHTHKQTVNDISTTCLSACVDNKYASCPDWRIIHMPITDHRETQTL